MPSNNRFRFADAVYESLGRTSLPLRTPPGIPAIMVEMDVVNADIPALLGMDLLDKESLTPCTVSNRLAKRVPIIDKEGNKAYVDKWCVPLRRSKSGHLYAQMHLVSGTFFTKSQLSKLHRQFFHPSAQKLFNLLRRARPEEATPETLKHLEELSRYCDPCQRIQNAPKRFKVTFGAENSRFNERIILDIMYLGSDPVLHVVDEGTRFGASRFLKDISTKSIWKALLECWATIYTGLPNRMLVDQGTQFGDLFINMAAASNVIVERTGVEAHSSLGIVERHHQPLRQTFRRIMVQFPNCDKELALAFAQKAMNDTLGPEGLVPSSLVFGEYPQVFTNSENQGQRATLDERSALATAARKEVESIMADMKIKRALHHAVPPAADQAYQPGDKVLVWREKQVSNRIGEWLGPFPVMASDESKKLVYVRDSEVGAARPFSFAQVKPYFAPEVLAQSFMVDIGRGLQQFKSPPKAEVHLTEVLNPRDERASSAGMMKAKKKEIANLMERGTFRVILKEDIPRDGNVLPGRFVLAIKSTEDGETKFKARYVIGGHRDKFKNMMVHSTTTLQPQSVRLLLALAAMHNFHIWTSDVRQAYLQSAQPLTRDIFIDKPVPEFELQPSQCLQLLKPLYGLCESGDHWHETLDKHHREELRMTPFKCDPALYYKMMNNVLCGLSGGYVDDLIRTGNQDFKKLSRKTKEVFDMAEDELLPCNFTGFSLRRGTGRDILIDQHAYLKNLEEIPLDAKFSRFRSMRMKLAWLSNSRPDCLFQISQLAQVTENAYERNRREIIKRLNKSIAYAIKSRTTLKVRKLRKDSLRIVGFSDASFANNHDFSTQLGYILFLADDSSSVVPILFKSYKARRVTRSAMSGEVIAFSDLFDAAAALAAELKNILNQTIPVQLLTDSKSLFDVISKGSRTSEKRTMLDVAAAREGFRDRVISDIGFVRSSQNVADDLTKDMSQAVLQRIIETATLHLHPEQWIIRKDSNKTKFTVFDTGGRGLEGFQGVA